MNTTFQKLPIKRQEEILDAAASVFAEGGYHHASVANICQKAGISNGSLYKYFKNKESLFFIIIDRCTSLLITDLLKKYTEEMHSFYETVYNVLVTIREFSVSSRDYLSIYMDLSSSSINLFGEKTSAQIEDAATIYLIQMVEKGKQLGEIDENIKSNIAAYFIDNYFMLYIYSFGSEYHKRRFYSFFSTELEDHTGDKEISIIMESIKTLLKTSK